MRAATRNDAAVFAAVITAAQATWMTWAGDTFHPYDLEQLTTQWGSRLDDPTTVAFVALDAQERVVAVAAAGPEKSSFEPSNTESGSAHLSTLFTLPEYHGTGFTQELHDQILGALAEAGYRTVRLWVPEGAHRARRFYERNGWEPTGTQTPFTGLTRVEMRRPI